MKYRNRIIIWFFMLLGLGACSTIEPVADQAQNTTEVKAKEVAQKRQAAHDNASLEKSKKDKEPVEQTLTADLLYELLVANIALEQGELTVATSSMARAAQLSESASLYSRAVRMAVHSKDYAQAHTLGETWLKIDQSDPLAYIITALAASLDDDNEAAYDLLEIFIARKKTKINEYFELIGDVFLRHAHGEKVVAMMDKLAQAHPKQIAAWTVVAGLAQKEQDTKTMLSALDKVLVIDSANQVAAGYKLLALTKMPDKLAKFVDDFMRQNPDAHQFALQYVRLLLQQKNNDLALARLLTLAKRDSNNAEALSLIAALYQEKNNNIKAVKYYRLRLKATPEDDQTRIFLANALQNLKRYEQARVELKKVKSSEYRLVAQRQMAQVIELDDGVDAGLAYLDGLQGASQEESIQLILDRELMLKRAQRVEAALIFITKSMQLYPNNATLRYHRALIHIEQNALAAHEADMRVLLEYEPDNAHYNNTLGYSLLTLTGRLDEAGDMINKAYDAMPKDAYILDSKGWLEYKKGSAQVALKHLLEAFEIDQDAEIAAHIGEIYWVEGEQEKARQFWLKGEEIEPDNKSLMKTKIKFLP